MSVSRINGIELERMLKNGLANLRLSEEEINRLNVFPVPDGDTGTNMCKTLEHGLAGATSSTDVSAFSKSLSSGMLLGARGNSGVILSRFFYGFAQALSRSALIGPGELRAALIKGYRAAYSAVINPVEGTMLSVAREGIEHIRTQITRSSPIDVILSTYTAEMRKTLAMTPEMLTVLKDAGVVDSGAAGFILIFEGMVKLLRGEIIEDNAPAAGIPTPASGPDLSLFNENSEFIDGYCMEFILQLMNGEGYRQGFRLRGYISALQKLGGESLVCVQDGKRVKVHVHTKTPALIIKLSQKYGEFLTFKLENMQVQHNERDSLLGRQEHKTLSIVSVVNGEGMKELFEGLGADYVIDGGATMNTSASEFVSVFEKIDADAIVVLPNSGNIIPAAKQAAELVSSGNVTVIPSKSFAEGYFAIAMDIPDEKDAERRVGQMLSGIENVVTLSEATASRDYTYHEIRCRKGEQIAFINGELASVSSDRVTAVTEALALIDGIEDYDTAVVLRGRDVPPEDEEELGRAVSEKYPLLELSFVDAGQEIYHWVIGIM